MGDAQHIGTLPAHGAGPPSESRNKQPLQTVPDESAFRSQLGGFQHANPQNASYDSQQAMDLRSLRQTLPTHSPIYPHGPSYSSQPSALQPQHHFYQMQQPHFVGQGYAMPQLPPMPPGAQYAYQQQQQPAQQMQGHFPMPQLHQHGHGGARANSVHTVNSVDSRLGPLGPFPSTPYEFSGFPSLNPAPAPVPSYPRGPPRKPKQSGFALWCGNLPPATTVEQLKDHFSRDAAKDILSILLIAKSNCAFVNYRTEASCAAAMHRFHDSRFHGVRLVCRLRRGSTAPESIQSTGPDDGGTTASSVGAGANIHDSHGPGAPEVVPSQGLADRPDAGAQDHAQPVIVGNPSSSPKEEAVTAVPGTKSADKIDEKFFVIKSLTAQDLESSVRNGVWATQNHNEAALNQAFKDAKNVYLIFSANKSGEYFGYARMASPISGPPVNLNSNEEMCTPNESNVPYSIFTPATATAPQGRIVDDSSRGTIFWEAELPDAAEDHEDTLEGKKTQSETPPGSNWGRQFNIEWISTTHLPFYRCRGLRNPWNSNREVKIARDGTEIEPTVGKRLLQMFHRPPPGHAQQSGAPMYHR